MIVKYIFFLLICLYVMEKYLVVLLTDTKVCDTYNFASFFDIYYATEGGSRVLRSHLYLVVPS